METAFAADPAVTDLADFWRRRTRGVQRYVNTAWVVEVARRTVFLASLLAMAAVLMSRREGWDGWVLPAVIGGLLFAAAGVSFWRARGRFISEEAARTTIEESLRLHSRLSAAAVGIGQWPEAERWEGTLWRWNWRRVLFLPACSCGLVLAAFLFPMFANLSAPPPPTAKPPALEKVEEWLELLAKTPQIEPESVSALREEAEQLARQDPTEWYSHASLEAADHLKAKMETGLKNLSTNATKLESLLAQSGKEAGNEWESALQEALGAMQGNIPGLNNDLAKRLSELDSSKFRSLTPEQLKQLREHLDRLKGLSRDELADKYAWSDEEGDEEVAVNGLGNGGVDRGPGTGPLKLGDTPVDLGTTEAESVENSDLNRAALGDAVGSSTGQHDVDKTKDHRAASGGAVAAGEGAGAVWQQQNLTPEERKRLELFFK